MRCSGLPAGSRPNPVIGYYKGPATGRAIRVSPVKNQLFPALGSNPRAAFRLFCFPHSGGGAAAFVRWQRRLPAGVELVSAHLPGREERYNEPALRRLDPLLDALVAGSTPGLDLPFAFFGQSLGAWIAFYLTRRLRREGLRQPAHLFVASCRAPQLASRFPPLSGLQGDAFLRLVQQRYCTLPRQILQDPEMLRLVLLALHADISLFETIQYTPEAPLSCGISAYGGERDTAVSETEIRAWCEQTTSHFTSQMFLADHLITQSTETALLDRISCEFAPYF